MNNVILIGRLTKDIEMKFLSESGTPVANFTIAVDRNYKTKNGEKITDFIPIQYMGKIAENLSNYIGKGSLVGVEGNLRIDRYEKDGENRTFAKINGRNIQFLDSKKNNSNEAGGFTPNFDTSDFQAIVDDEEIPF